VTSAAEVPLLVLPCRAQKIRFVGHSSLPQQSWSCTTRASYQYSCKVRTISKTDACRIDALDQWCLCMLLGIKWYRFVRHDDVRKLTKQPKLTAIIQSCRLFVLAYYAHGRQRRSQEDPVSLWWTGEYSQVVPASRGSAPSNRIRNNTTLRSLKQQVWLRTVLRGGWCWLWNTLPTDIKRAATLLTFLKNSRPFFSLNVYADFTVFYHPLFTTHCIYICKQLVI